MTERFTIAEAKNVLTRLIREVETKAPVVLTRRGIPVAVLMSYDEFSRRTPSTSFLDAVAVFRIAQGDGLSELAEVFEDVRDAARGREVSL